MFSYPVVSLAFLFGISSALSYISVNTATSDTGVPFYLFEDIWISLGKGDRIEALTDFLFLSNVKLAPSVCPVVFDRGGGSGMAVKRSIYWQCRGSAAYQKEIYKPCPAGFSSLLQPELPPCR